VDIKLKIGQRIKELREKAEMSQKDLAYTADLDRIISQVLKMESVMFLLSILKRSPMR
jgi:transcriptional regulator with XRE-family HTH domain